MPDIRLAEVTPAPISYAHLVSLVERPTAGAISLFLGTVRDNDPQANGDVVSLDYTSHPTAPDRLREIVLEVLADLDPEEQAAVAVSHRIGHLVVGDAAFVVAVSSAHRALSMRVCDQIVESVKAGLPIWKQQFESDGTFQWSGL